MGQVYNMHSERAWAECNSRMFVYTEDSQINLEAPIKMYLKLHYLI